MGSRKSVGLALGGGMARGISHIGIVSVLVQAGIPIDYVAGTSAGSVVAASYCAGLSAEQIMENALKFHWWRIVRPVWPKRGLVSFDGLRRWLVRLLGDLQFADLKSPCTIVATDLELGVPVELNEGRVAPAVQASCSIPGFVAPVELDGRLLCDGGISDMLPVSVLRKMGADYVIAVDIFPFKLRSYLGPLGHFWAALEILFERAGGGIGAADCLIAPDLCGYSYLSLSKRKELDELGRQAASEKLECIRQALGMNHANKPVPAVKELQL